MGPRLTYHNLYRTFPCSLCRFDNIPKDLICNSTTHRFPAVPIIIFRSYDVVLTACPCLVFPAISSLSSSSYVTLCHTYPHLVFPSLSLSPRLALSRSVSHLISFISPMLIISARRSVVYFTVLLSCQNTNHTQKERATHTHLKSERGPKDPKKKQPLVNW